MIFNQSLLKRDKGKTGTILLIEDDEDTAEFITTALTTETRYDVLLMRSGPEALQHLETIKKSRPILLLLDYWLPTMNGLDLYTQLHAREALMHAPTMILTAFSLNEEVTEAFAQLGVPILNKPFDLDMFIALVKQTTADFPG